MNHNYKYLESMELCPSPCFVSFRLTYASPVYIDIECHPGGDEPASWVGGRSNGSTCISPLAWRGGLSHPKRIIVSGHLRHQRPVGCEKHVPFPETNSEFTRLPPEH